MIFNLFYLFVFWWSKQRASFSLPQPELLPSHALVDDDVLDVPGCAQAPDELLLEQQRRRRDDFLVVCVFDHKDVIGARRWFLS